MSFRERLLATLHAARPVFEVPGVVVVGSQVPNLLKPDVAATLAVSNDVDIGVPVSSHAEVKARLRHPLRSNLTILSLMEPRSEMPDPQPRRAQVAALLRGLEAGSGDRP